MDSGGIEHVGIYLDQLLNVQLLFRGYLRMLAYQTYCLVT